MAQKKTYKCYECGEICYSYNEGQCPYCKTIDSLMCPREESPLEEEGDCFSYIELPD
jgi:hypothetical protein